MATPLHHALPVAQKLPLHRQAEMPSISFNSGIPESNGDIKSSSVLSLLLRTRHHATCNASFTAFSLLRISFEYLRKDAVLYHISINAKMQDGNAINNGVIHIRNVSICPPFIHQISITVRPSHKSWHSQYLYVASIQYHRPDSLTRFQAWQALPVHPMTYRTGIPLTRHRT